MKGEKKYHKYGEHLMFLKIKGGPPKKEKKRKKIKTKHLKESRILNKT